MNWAVVVAVIAVLVVQATVHQIIKVVAVRNLLVSAVHMLAGALGGRALGGVSGADRKDMLVIVAFVRRVQMALVQIIHMVFVLDARVTAGGAVNMNMILVRYVCHCRVSP